MQKGAPKRKDCCSCCSQGMGGIEAAPAASSCLPSSTHSPHAPFDPLVEAAVAELSSVGFRTHRRVSKMVATSVFLSTFSDSAISHRRTQKLSHLLTAITPGDS